MFEATGEVFTEEPLSCSKLVREFQSSRETEARARGEKLKFYKPVHRLTAPFRRGENDDVDAIAGEVTIYNPSKEIEIDGKKMLIGRVERLDEEESRTMFFTDLDNDGEYELDEEAPMLSIQDPFYCGRLHDKDGELWHVLGGVKKFTEENGDIYHKTVFYKFRNSLHELKTDIGEPEFFASGPERMKDVRSVQMMDGRLGVFTRPLTSCHGFGERGRIGFITVDSIDELESALREHVGRKDMGELINDLCGEDEWVGANELHLLPDGRIGVLGHIAEMVTVVENGIEKAKKNYYAMAFIFDPRNRTHTPVKIIAAMDDFDNVRPKKDDLGSIVFSGGLKVNEDRTAWLYLGLGDTEAGRILIKNPFSEE